MKLESLVIAGQLYCGEYCSRVLYSLPVKPREPGIPKVSVYRAYGKLGDKG